MGIIAVGESYEYAVGKWDGFFDTFKTCQRCADITQWVQNNVPCLCWRHGNRIEDCREAVEEAFYRAPSEAVGLRFGFLRRVVARDLLNKGRAARAWPGISATASKL